MSDDELVYDVVDLGPRVPGGRVRTQLGMSLRRGSRPGEYALVCGAKNPVGGRCMAPVAYVVEIDCVQGHARSQGACYRHALLAVRAVQNHDVWCEVCADFQLRNPVMLRGDTVLFAADAEEFLRAGRPSSSQIPLHEGSDCCWDCYADQPQLYAQFPTVCRHRLPPPPPL